MPTYKNLDGTTPTNGFGSILKWKVFDPLSGNGRSTPKHYPTPRRESDLARVQSLAPSLTWVGHATFALRLGKKMIVTDPIWSERINGVVPRNASPGLPLASMPPIDLVTISHSHFDHLDLPTLEKIGKRTRFVVPKDVGEILRGRGLTDVIELDWWQTHREDGVAITLVPAQHWSMRVPWDRNKRLWGGFVYESDEGVAYHAGDTAFSPDVFEAIKSRCPKIDWAMLPIGAYEPVWFMKPQHMGPEEALEAYSILGAKNLCAMHWGTFKLTDEPLEEPPARLRSAWAARHLGPKHLWVFDIGETRRLAQTHESP